MRKANEPSSLRKVFVTIAATFATLALFGLLFGASYLIAPAAKEALNGQTASNLVAMTQHIHAVLMVFVNGKLLDFTLPEYQNRDVRINFENGDGITVHKPDHDAYLGQLLESVNVTVANNCLTLANGSSYCSNFDKDVSVFVNGVPEGNFQHYVPINNDRILISYGKPEEISKQLQQLDAAVIST